MSIFSKSEINKANNKKNQFSIPTIISGDLTVRGEVESYGIVEIEGKIIGKVKGSSVIIREKGFVDGEVISENFTVKGIFKGKILAKNIIICAKSEVYGDVQYQSLRVEDGALIDANFKKIEKFELVGE